VVFLRENRLRGLKTLKSDRSREIRFLPEDEIQTILDVADDVARRAILILLYTGWRRSEFAYLEWKDIDFQNGFNNVQSKPGFAFTLRAVKLGLYPCVVNCGSF